MQEQISTVLTVRTAMRFARAKLAWRIPRATFYRMIEDGRIRHQRIGTRIAISRRDLEQFIDRCHRGERF